LHPPTADRERAGAEPEESGGELWSVEREPFPKPAATTTTAVSEKNNKSTRENKEN